MKKLVFCFFILFLNSCAITSTMVGDVTAYKYNGEILCKWEKVSLQEINNGTVTNSSFKNFGLNFYDSKTQKFFIVGNAVPYIVEYNNCYYNGNTYNSKSESNEYKKDLISKWQDLSNIHSQLKNKIKNTDRNSEEYESYKNKLRGISKQMDSIAHKLYTDFNYDILAMGVR